QIDFDPGSNIVEVHMYQLRKKMTKIAETPAIETVVGMGYILRGQKITSDQ
ncbi:MAG: winged helix family transcriptional regulator, partial [Pedobacter sp.]